MHALAVNKFIPIHRVVCSALRAEIELRRLLALFATMIAAKRNPAFMGVDLLRAELLTVVTANRAEFLALGGHGFLLR